MLWTWKAITTILFAISVIMQITATVYLLTEIIGDKFLQMLSLCAFILRNICAVWKMQRMIWGQILLARLKKNFGDPVNVELFLQKYVREKVEKRIESKRHSSASRLLRLKNVFEKDRGVKISEEEKEWMTSPFPILLGSTTVKGFFLLRESEANLVSAKWGEEIDLVFVREEDLQKMTGWLQRHGLENKVQVHSKEILSPLFDVPLYHAHGDVVGERTALSSMDYRYINAHIQDCVPLYQKPFPGGSPRVHHGVVHATRAALFTAVIAEMYLAQGHTLSASAKNLPSQDFCTKPVGNPTSERICGIGKVRKFARSS